MLRTYPIDAVDYAAKKSAGWLVIVAVIGSFLAYYFGAFNPEAGSRVTGFIIIYLLLAIVVINCVEKREREKFGRIDGEEMEIIDGRVVGCHRGPCLYKIEDLGQRQLIPLPNKPIVVIRTVVAPLNTELVATCTIEMHLVPDQDRLQAFYNCARYNVDHVAGEILIRVILNDRNGEWLPSGSDWQPTQIGQEDCAASPVQEELFKNLCAHGLCLLQVGGWNGTFRHLVSNEQAIK